jgi:hypothetical protein
MNVKVLSWPISAIIVAHSFFVLSPIPLSTLSGHWCMLNFAGTIVGGILHVNHRLVHYLGQECHDYFLLDTEGVLRLRSHILTRNILWNAVSKYRFF